MTHPEKDPDGDGDTDPELTHMESIRALQQAANAKREKAGDIYQKLVIALKCEREAETQPHADKFFAAVIPILEKYERQFDEATRIYRQVIHQAQEEADVQALKLRRVFEQQSRERRAAVPSCEHCHSYQIRDGKCMRCPGVPVTDAKPARRPAKRVLS